MTSEATAQDTRTLVVEREIKHPADKVWRALTQSHLIEEWLMRNDFEPTQGRRFQLRTDPMPQWNGIIDCEVLAVEPTSRLSYTWVSGGMPTVVTYTLTPTAEGVLVRMEQTGFPAEAEHAYRGASYGWPRMLESLEAAAAKA